MNHINKTTSTDPIAAVSITQSPQNLITEEVIKALFARASEDSCIIYVKYRTTEYVLIQGEHVIQKTVDYGRVSDRTLKYIDGCYTPHIVTEESEYNLILLSDIITISLIECDRTQGAK